MRLAWRGTAAILLCLALLLGACGTEIPARPPAEEGREPGVELWMTADAPLCRGLQALTEQYRELEPQCEVRVTVFASEEELEAALAEETPDLLLCGGSRMLSLEAAGALHPLAFSAESAPRVLPMFLGLGEPVGSSYFPLGAEMQLLVFREENRGRLAGCESLEALCAEAARYAGAEGAPFLAVDSLSRLFACAMAQKGCEFQARRELDIGREAYREVYNLLADAVFDGGLTLSEEPAAALVRRGEVLCGICSSRVLSETEEGALSALPVPAMDGCDNLSDAEIWGLAALRPEPDTETVRYVSWLCTYDHASREVLAAGMIPASASWGKDAGGTAEGLALAAKSCRLYLPAADSGFLLRGAEFEESFRAALALLR